MYISIYLNKFFGYYIVKIYQNSINAIIEKKEIFILFVKYLFFFLLLYKVI